MIDDVAQLLSRLVAIPSVNPGLVPGAVGEAAVGDFCQGWLSERGFEVHRIEVSPGRPSIVGIARGRGGGPSLMLNGHYDTVTLAGYDGDPLSGERRDGKIFGRGAFDMKSGVAAMMVAAARAKEEGLEGDVVVACVADEENTSFGTQEVLERFRTDAAIVTEPSHLQITIAHKGFAWFDVVVKGRAAHGSRPHQGIDAIVKAGRFLVELGKLDERMRADPTHPRLGSGSVHASLIAGGQEMSSIPAECRIGLEWRTLPGETPEILAARLQSILDALSAEDPEFAAEIVPGTVRPPFEVSRQAEVVQTLLAAATRRLDRAPEWRGGPGWTDCALISDAGIPVVQIGVDGGGAHSATEWADERSLAVLTDILADTIVAYCRRSDSTQ